MSLLSSIFGGGGGSSSTQANTTSTAVDMRQALEGSVGIPIYGSTISGGVSVNLTDGGASVASSQASLGASQSAALASGYASDAAAKAAGWAADAIRSVAQSANDLAGGTVAGAFDLAKTSSDAAYKDLNAALGFGAQALTLTKDNFKSTLDLTTKNIDLANDTAKTIQQAYQSAQDGNTGNRTVIIIALAVAAIVGFAALKKG